jgi:hypothetical protein
MEKKKKVKTRSGVVQQMIEIKKQIGLEIMGMNYEELRAYIDNKIKASKEENELEKNDFSSCFGAWDDNRTAEEIIADLKADRVNSKHKEEF